jgi:hypothetical protein
MAFALPSLESVSRPQIIIPFTALVIPAAGFVTLVSTAIPFPFKITRIYVLMPAAVEAHIYTSNNRTAPITGLPPDTDIFAPYSPTPYLTWAGGFTFASDLNYIPPEGHQYVKVTFALPGGGAAIYTVIIGIEPQ